MRLPITSTSFVAAPLSIPLTTEGSFRIAVQENGLGILRPEIAGVNHSRPGRRYCASPLLPGKSLTTLNPRLTLLTLMPTSPSHDATSYSAANSSCGLNNLPQAISIPLSGPALLHLLRCFGADLGEMLRARCRGYTITRTGSRRGVLRRSLCSQNGARCDRASAILLHDALYTTLGLL